MLSHLSLETKIRSVNYKLLAEIAVISAANKVVSSLLINVINIKGQRGDNNNEKSTQRVNRDFYKKKYIPAKIIVKK